jgi:hypothetical protein
MQMFTIDIDECIKQTQTEHSQLLTPTIRHVQSFLSDVRSFVDLSRSVAVKINTLSPHSFLRSFMLNIPAMRFFLEDMLPGSELSSHTQN